MTPRSCMKQEGLLTQESHSSELLNRGALPGRRYQNQPVSASMLSAAKSLAESETTGSASDTHVCVLSVVELVCGTSKSVGRATDADDDYLERRASQRQAAMSRINLQRLDSAALRRYRRFYKLPDVGPNSTKEQLLAAINRHFSQQVRSLPCSEPSLARCLGTFAMGTALQHGYARAKHTMLSIAVGVEVCKRVRNCSRIRHRCVPMLRADWWVVIMQAVDENRVIAMFVYTARQQALHGPSHEQ